MDERKVIDVTDVLFEGRKNNKDKYSTEIFEYILNDTPFAMYASDIFNNLLSIKYGNVSLLEEERMNHNKEYFQNT